MTDEWPSVPDDALGDGFGAVLQRWAAEARVDEAARVRLREHWLRRQATEETSFTGLLVDLAERGGPTLVTTTDGDRIRGRLVAIGRDFVALRGDHGQDALVALVAVAGVRAASGPEPLGSPRAAELQLSLAEAIGVLAEERPRVSVRIGASETVSGELRSAGRDLLTLRLDGEQPDHLYVRIDAVRVVAGL